EVKTISNPRHPHGSNSCVDFGCTTVSTTRQEIRPLRARPPFQDASTSSGCPTALNRHLPNLSDLYHLRFRPRQIRRVLRSATASGPACRVEAVDRGPGSIPIGL